MNFQRSAASMFQPVKDLHIKREHELANLLQTYEAQQESSLCPDRTLLSRAQVLLGERLREHLNVDQELVELGHVTYRSLGAWHQEIALLRHYLATHPTADEQAWARWHIIDCLSLAGEASEAVSEQQKLLVWSTQVFPLQDCFFVLADGTQARSWLKIGQGAEWLRQYHQFDNQAPHTSDNRLDRFYCLRTAVHLCLSLGDLTQVDSLLEKLHQLEQENPAWTELRWIRVEVVILDIIVADKRGDAVLVRNLAMIATTKLETWECELNSHDPSEIMRFRSLSHNVAAPLYRGKQYDLAIPLLRKAVDYHTNPHYAYLWLAASLWQTTHQREQVFPYLRQAIARYDGEGNPWDTFQKLPEFEDVRQDPEFLKVATLSSK